MYIRFNDTGEIFLITGERRQFWLFDKNGEPSKAVKGSGSYTLFDIEDAGLELSEVIEEYDDIKIREELDESDFEEI